jgi:nucleoid DNA-binding protein
MSFVELIESISSETGLTKKAVRDVLHSFLNTAASQVLSGNDIRLPGFGRFTKKVIKPKVMFGKQTRTTVKFRPYV